MTRRDRRRPASQRTGFVRFVGLVAFVFAGLPLGGLAVLSIAGSIEKAGVMSNWWRPALYGLVSLAALAMSLRTLLVMPRQGRCERRVGLCAAVVGVGLVVPAALLKWPFGLPGLVLVVAGLLLAVELVIQLRGSHEVTSP